MTQDEKKDDRALLLPGDPSAPVTTEALPNTDADYLDYARHHIACALLKRDDAPMSSAQHERQARLTLQLERIPSAKESLDWESDAPRDPETWPCSFSHHVHATRQEAVECARKRQIGSATPVSVAEHVGISAGAQAPESSSSNSDSSSTLERAQQEIERLKASHEKELLEIIDERDGAQDWADKLAYAIAPLEVIGEHSNLNNPWSNALDSLEVERQQHADALGKRQAAFTAEEVRATSAESTAFSQAARAERAEALLVEREQRAFEAGRRSVVTHPGQSKEDAFAAYQQETHA